MAIDKTLIKYFSVKWTALVSMIDGLDSDDIPDTDFISGVITFKPLLSGAPMRFINIPEPFTVVPLSRRINIAAGEFTDQTRKFIKLEAAGGGGSIPTNWNWQAIFDLNYAGIPIPLSPVQFMGAPGATLDLTNELPTKDLISGIDYAKGDRGADGYGVGSITLSGANNDVLNFFSAAPGTPLLTSVTIPALTAAGSSATSAANSAAAALASKNAAGTSETNAANSANSITGSVTAAGNSATAASGSASSALASKNAAGTSETNALASKNAAGTSETNALASKNAAGTSETNALASKNAAATSATNAATSETNAANSASSMSTSVTAAQTARTGAETARTGAEQARDAATSGVVPDASVTRAKLKTEDITNLVMGGGFENGLEPTDWTVNGLVGAIDTSLFFDGTRSYKITGTSGDMTGPGIPTSQGEVFQFSMLAYLPSALTGAGGLRCQALTGSTWNDVGASASLFPETSSITVANTWTRCYGQYVMPAGVRRVRWRLAYALTSNPGINVDDVDFRRIPELVAPGSVGASQIADGNVTLQKLASNSVDSSKIVDGSIALADLASNSVNSSKIVDASIATADLAPNIITAGYLANGAVDTAARVANGPMDTISAQSVRFHDMLAFHSGMTVTQESTTDGGTTWNPAALDTRPFTSREDQSVVLTDGAAANKGVRWKFVGTGYPLSNAMAKFLYLAFPYVGVAPSRTIILESSPDGTAWTTRNTFAAVAANAQGYLQDITDWGGHTQVRLTIIMTNASPLNLSSVQILSQRSGSEGRGPEVSLPFSWDFSKTITLTALKLPNGSPALGKVLTSAADGTVSWEYVDSNKITDGSIALADLASNSVDSSKIIDGSIALADLASNSVDSSKIVDGSIALSDLASNSVDSSKIVDGSISTAEIAAKAVTIAKIGSAAATSGQVLSADGAGGVAFTNPAGGTGADARFTVFETDIGDGATAGPYNVVHNLGTRSTQLTLYRKASPWEEIRHIDPRHLLNSIQILTDVPLPKCRAMVVGLVGSSDVTAPAKAVVTISSVTDTTITAAATATDAVGVVGYNWYIGGAYVGSGASPYTFTGQAPSTTYAVTASAFDDATNVGPISDPVNATTTVSAIKPDVAYVGAAGARVSNSNTLAVPYTFGSAASRIGLAFVVPTHANFAASSTYTASLNSNVDGLWTLLGTVDAMPASDVSGSVRVYYKLNPTAGAQTLTASEVLSGQPLDGLTVSILEYSGVGSVTGFTTRSIGYTGANAAHTLTIPSAAGDMNIACFANDGTIAALVSGKTARYASAGPNVGGNSDSAAVFDAVGAATSVTITSSNLFATAIDAGVRLVKAT